MGYKILVAHGTTKTGYGIRQRSNGTLRPISHCCGRTMEYGDDAEEVLTCKGCGMNHSANESKFRCSLGHDIDAALINRVHLNNWVSNVIGEPATVEVTA